MGGQNINLEENSTLSSGFAYISEMIRYLISGTTAFLLYWPFGWIFLNYNYFQNNNIIAVFVLAYQQLLNVSISWSAAPLFLILPYFGLLNRAIIYTLVETMLIKYFYKGLATGINGLFHSKKSSEEKASKNASEKSKYSILCLRKQFDMKSNKTMEYLESCINPCWQLSGSFEFIDFQEWLLKDKIRNKIWDHMRLMYGIYGSFYLTFLTFVILYILFFVFNLCFVYKNIQLNNIFDYLIGPLIIFVILLILTFALYVNYLRHRFDWLAMNVRYYVKYLIEVRTDIINDKIDELNKCILHEQYKKISEILEETHDRIISPETKHSMEWLWCFLAQ